MNGLENLERHLAARAREAPGGALRARVLEALERERRSQQRTWASLAAAAWIVALGAAWGAGPGQGDVSTHSVLEVFARGPDLSLVPRLARPIGPTGEFAP